MWTHTPETAAKHLERNVVTAMAQASLQAYGESPILTDDSAEDPGTAEDNPTHPQRDATGPPADWIAEAADTLNTTHKDKQAAEASPPNRHYNQDSIQIDILEVQMSKENIHPIYSFTSDTDDEYLVFFT